MCNEVDKFVDGHHQKDIAHVRVLIDKLNAPKFPKASTNLLIFHKSYDKLQMKVGSPTIQAIIMKAVLLKSYQDIPAIVSELLLIKQLQVIFIKSIHNLILLNIWL